MEREGTNFMHGQTLGDRVSIPTPTGRYAHIPLTHARARPDATDTAAGLPPSYATTVGAYEQLRSALDRTVAEYTLKVRTTGRGVDRERDPIGATRTLPHKGALHCPRRQLASQLLPLGPE